MAKKTDNYSWLDKYSTDPRDSDFRDITERHQDRQQYNDDRDAHDRDNDGLNLAASGTSTSGLYDDLVFDGSRGHAPTAPPRPSSPTPTSTSTSTSISAVPPKRRVAPAPPGSMPPPPQVVPPGSIPPPPPAAPRAQRRPDRLPSIQPGPLKPSPSVAPRAEPRPLPADGTSLLERLRQVPRSVFIPVIFGALILISSLSDGADTPTSTPPAAPVAGSGTPIGDLVPGDCFAAPPGPGIVLVQVRSCTQAHGGEVIALASGSVSEALEQCTTATQRLRPTAISRLPGDATFTLLLNDPSHRCVVLSSSGSLVGSVLSAD